MECNNDQGNPYDDVTKYCCYTGADIGINFDSFVGDCDTGNYWDFGDPVSLNQYTYTMRYGASAGNRYISYC